MTNSALLIFGAMIALSGLNDSAFSQPLDCRRLDLSAITSIEDHGKNLDVFSDRLFATALILEHARKACRENRNIEARALYQSVFSLVGELGAIKPADLGTPNEKVASCN